MFHTSRITLANSSISNLNASRGPRPLSWRGWTFSQKRPQKSKPKQRKLRKYQNVSLCNNVISTEFLCPVCLAPECHFSARFRTRQTRGQLVAVSSQQGRDRFALQLLEGHLCVLLQFRPDPARSLCLSKAQVTDGQWHTVAAIR